MIYPDSFENKIGFDNIRSSIKELCISPMGIALVDEMSMSTDHAEIEYRLRITHEMLTDISSDDPWHPDTLDDIAIVLQHARPEGTFIAPSDMLAVARTLRLAAETASHFGRKEEDNDTPACQLLCDKCDTLTPHPTLLHEIDRILDRHGEVRDNASPELARIRHDLQDISGTVNSIMRRVMARAISEGYLDSDATPTMRDGRLVLPVSPMHKRKINGIVHDESASGKTVFIEPGEVVQTNNRIRELKAEERREITRILTALTTLVRPHIDTILHNQNLLGEFDFIRAKALYARNINACLPMLDNIAEPYIEWYHAVHPVLLESLRRHGKEVVPLDITLDNKNRILIISGPNAGGKSVCLKTVGVVQYMSQCGLLPPIYENSHIGTFDNIFVDIGDDQSIENDLSTYSSHLRNMRHFLSHGTPSTLMLIDEFGSGTEPQIGAAIAQAILQQFNTVQARGVITTHYQNIKHYADETPGLINGSMLYDRQMMQPLYRLSIGTPGSSFALEIARKTGLPQNIIDNAREIVGSEYVNMDKYLLDIARDKRYWENKRLSIRQKEKRIDEVLERYENDADNLRQQRRTIIAEAKEEARKILDGSNAAIERTIHDIKRAQADRERTLEARRRLKAEKEALTRQEAENPLLAKAPKRKKEHVGQSAKEPIAVKPISVGDFVKLDGQGVPGKVLEVQGKNITVAFGTLKTTVKADRLKHTMQRPATSASQTSTLSRATIDAQREKQLQFKQEIDVRGMRADEAIQAVTYYLDDAIRFNAGRVRILHGTGTGALRVALRQYLGTVPGVASFHDEDVRFGGAGITVVELS